MYNKLLILASESYGNFRRWFNARFKLVINNRYAGLSRIDTSLFVMFIYRLSVCLECDLRGSYNCVDRAYFKFKLGNDTIKIYPF